MKSHELEILLDRLAEALREHDKLRGERDIAHSRIRDLENRYQHLDEQMTAFREVHDFTSSESFHSLLLFIHGEIKGQPDFAEMQERVEDAMIRTAPIPLSGR